MGNEIDTSKLMSETRQMSGRRVIKSSVKEITDGALVDVMMDVSGAPSNMEISVDLVRKMGTIVTPGLYGPHFAAMDFDKVVQKELKICGALAQSYHSNEIAVKLVESRK